MGRQIGFYQLEDDINDLINFLHSKGLSLFDSKGNVETVAKNVLNKFVYYIGNSDFNTKYGTIEEYYAKNYDCGDDVPPVIEYSPPEILLPSQVRTCTELSIGKDGENDGRFYLSNDWYQNQSIVKTYNALVKYIKSSYKYSRNTEYYFSSRFLKAYDEGMIIPCNTRNQLFGKLFDSKS